LVYSADDINEVETDMLIERYLVTSGAGSTISDEKKTQEQKTTVTWAIMDSTHVEQVIDIVSRACVDHEPLMYTKKVDYDDFRKLTRDVVRAAAKTGLSTVGLLGDIVVSVVLSEDFHQIRNSLYERPISTKANKVEEALEMSKGLRAIFELLKELNQQFMSYRGVNLEKIPKGKFFHIALTAVREGYGKRGLSSVNVEENLEVARARGYREAVESVTGLHAQKILTRLGFKTLSEIQYKDWKYGVLAPFDNVEETTGHPSVKLMALVL